MIEINNSLMIVQQPIDLNGVPDRPFSEVRKLRSVKRNLSNATDVYQMKTEHNESNNISYKHFLEEPPNNNKRRNISEQALIIK